MVKSYAKIPSVTDGESITDAIIRVHNLIRETEFHVPVATFTQWQLESWTLEFMKYKERAERYAAKLRSMGVNPDEVG